MKKGQQNSFEAIFGQFLQNGRQPEHLEKSNVGYTSVHGPGN